MNFDFGVDHEWCYTEKCKKVTTTRSAIVDATLAAERFQKFVSHGLYYAQIQRLQSLEFPFYFNFRCFFFLRFYLFWKRMREIEHERGEGQREKQNPCWSRVSRIMAWAEGSRLTNWATQAPNFFFFFLSQALSEKWFSWVTFGSTDNNNCMGKG